MTAEQPIDFLRRVAALARERLGDDGARFADKIDRYLMEAPIGATLDDMFDLTPEPGRPAWHSVEARDDRNSLIRHAARKYFPGFRTAQQAAKICLEVKRYRAAGWRSDQRAPAMPEVHRGTLRGVLYELVSRFGGVPDKRQVQRILRCDNGLTMSSATPYSCHREPEILPALDTKEAS